MDFSSGLDTQTSRGQRVGGVVKGERAVEGHTLVAIL